MTTRSSTRRQTQSLKRLEAARARLLAIVDGLDEATLCGETVVDDWTVKDIFGHLVTWNEEFRADIAVILAGRHPGYERQISGRDDFAAWNEAQIAARRDRTWARVLADFERDIAEARQLIGALRPADLRRRGVTPWQRAAQERPAELKTEDTDSVLTLINYHWRHMNQHARTLERWRAERRES